ncbi:diguanylate cyclase [Lapidilactobacillus achengensis]|uniref:Diguanylate cyclase n=1 Tax=Lapidilactobacillus achengensis TaxID=2486000 RepID=A0ABW1UPD7_9LACO|nr:GGDEF domain-containing protein [Lapidilactobacillus achengensis]
MIEISGVTLIVMELLVIFGTLFVFQFVGNSYSRRHSNDAVWVGKMDWQLRLITTILFCLVGIILVTFQKLTASDSRIAVNLVIASMIMVMTFVSQDVIVAVFDVTALYYFALHGIDPSTLAYVVFYAVLFGFLLGVTRNTKVGPWWRLLLFNLLGALYWLATYAFYVQIMHVLDMSVRQLFYYLLQMIVLISVPYTVAYSMQLDQLTVFKRTQEVYLDGLTHVYNYHAFNLNLEHAFQFSQENQTPLSMMVLDLDHFKHINDTYGHLAGNYVLVHFCEVVLEQLPVSSEYKLYRIGGEEFALIFSETESTQALALAKQIEQRVRDAEFIYRGTAIRLTFSGGLAQTGADDLTSRQFYDRVDGLTYLSKQKGRDQITVGPRLMNGLND